MNPFKKAATNVKANTSWSRSVESLNTLQMLPFWQHKRPVWTDWSTEKAIHDGYRVSVWVYACIEKIAEAACSVPWHVERREGNEWKREVGHPIETLLENSVVSLPLLSGRTLFQLTTQHLYLGGNAIWYVIFSGGYPVEIWPLAPDKVKPVITSDGLIEHYEYIVDGKRQIIPPENIAHFMFPDPANMYWGMSKLRAAAMVIDTDLEAIAWNKMAMQNRAVSDGVFTFKGIMTREQWDEARRQIREQHQGAQNARTPWVLGADASWQSMSLSPQEMDFINSRKFNMYEIHAVFGVDPLLTGAPDHSGRANKVEAKKEFWQDTVIPYLDKLKDCMNNTILVPFDPARHTGKAPELRLVYDLANVDALQDSFHIKVQSAERLYRMGVPFNEINRRLEMGFHDVPGGEIPYNIFGSFQGLTETQNSPGEGDTMGDNQNQDESEKNKALVRLKEKKNIRTEEEKVFYWKAFDRKLVSWERRIVRDIEDLFDQEGDAVVNLFKKTASEIRTLALLDEWSYNWENILLAIYPRVIEDFGKRGYQEIEELVKKKKGFQNNKKDFDMTRSIILRWVRQNAAIKCTLITEETKRVIAEIISRGFQENLPLTEIAQQIKEQYEWWKLPDPQQLTYRAMRIARTEVHSAAGFGQHAGVLAATRDLQVETIKTWLSSRDDRVRDLHAAIDGQSVPINEPFSNGLMYPGDPSGPGYEVINCRCTEVHDVL